MNASNPAIAAQWEAVCKKNDDAEAAMIADLRSWGVKGAHPDDGWVDQDADSILPAYEWYNDGVKVGDTYALGSPDKVRLVIIERIGDVGGLFVAGERVRYHFRSAGCATCMSLTAAGMRRWPTIGGAFHPLCASCMSDVDRSRTSGRTTPRTAKSIAQWCRSACQMKAPRWSATIAGWIRKSFRCG